MKLAIASAIRRWLAIVAAVAAPIALVGCRDESPGERPRGPAIQAGGQGGLFESVAENLNHLEQFDTAQILKQTCDRLNQWYLQEKPQVAWQRDPLIEGLSEHLREESGVASLDGVRFRTPNDGWFLQEAVWLRDISAAARADQFEDLAVAERLFDWTVRNIQLESDVDPNGDPVKPRWPYQTLLLGRGTALDRAWVFILLARQQGLDVVMLALADDDGASVRPWLPALLLDDELYLFDCRLGLAVPGPTEGSVATLAQAAADKEILGRLDLDDARPYPVHAEDLTRVVAWVEGSPSSLSHRMALVESRLAGKHKLQLTSPGSALAERVAKLPHVADAKLWPWPFEVWHRKAHFDRRQAADAMREMVLYQMPSLKRGRALHFRGDFDGNEGAKASYMSARPSDEQIDAYRLSEEMHAKLTRGNAARLEAAQILMMREAKQNASFWIGLIFFEQEDYPNAIDFFAKRTLGAAANSPWTASARYNLARTYEADGNLAKAIELYETDTDSPQSHGNQLRARRLKQQTAAAADEPPADNGNGARPSEATGN